MAVFLSQPELADQQIWVEPPPRVLTTEVGQHVGERVILDGWLHQLRRMGGVNFLILRDRKGLLQIVLNDVSSLQHMLPESVLRVSGLVVAESRAQGGYELQRSEYRGDLSSDRSTAVFDPSSGCKRSPGYLPGSPDCGSAPPSSAS